MKHEDSHLSDQELLLDVDGELSTHDEKLVRAHLKACWKCRARRQELDRAIADFVRFHKAESDAKLPPITGPRALLRAQLAASDVKQPSRWFRPLYRVRWVAVAACSLLILALLVSNVGRHRPLRPRVAIVSIPDSRFTPGAALLVDQRQLCSQPNVKNKAVPVDLQRKVLEEYGIAGAEPRAYEIDYLITPALGGADDIRNLWPQSHSATTWNAEVKDALEDRLRQMVCDGNLDLTEAQQEIAKNWIAAYQKYFRTDTPLPEPR